MISIIVIPSVVPTAMIITTITTIPISVVPVGPATTQ
jgi:hypothetical protein